MARKSEVEYVDICLVKPDPDQPRKYFDAEKIATLRSSIREHGIKVPLILERNESEYLIVDGERRYRAAKEEHLKEIPAIITTSKSRIDRLIERFHIQEQHQGWTSAEKAMAIIGLAEELRQPVKEIAKILGIAEREMRHYMAFAKIVDKESFIKNETPMTYAEKIDNLKNAVRRVYHEVLEEEFDRNSEKRLEEAVIERIKSGIINQRGDFQKIQDSIKKQPEIIKEFLEDHTVSPEKLFLKTKANGVYHLRNVVNGSSFLASHIRRLLEEKDVAMSQDGVRIVRTTYEELGKLLRIVD